MKPNYAASVIKRKKFEEKTDLAGKVFCDKNLSFCATAAKKEEKTETFVIWRFVLFLRLSAKRRVVCRRCRR